MKNKILLSVGDSFSYGSGLQHSIPQKEKSFTGHMAEKMNFKFVNKSRPGCSNQNIVRNCIDYVVENGNKDLVVVVCWSHLERIELFYKGEYQNLNSFFVDNESKDNILNLACDFENLTTDTKPPDKNNIIPSADWWLDYYYNFVDVYKSLHDTLLNQLLLKNFLEYNNIPFLFCESCKLNFHFTYPYHKSDPMEHLTYRQLMDSLNIIDDKFEKYFNEIRNEDFYYNKSISRLTYESGLENYKYEYNTHDGKLKQKALDLKKRQQIWTSCNHPSDESHEYIAEILVKFVYDKGIVNEVA
jgi:hypothetical protein